MQTRYLKVRTGYRDYFLKNKGHQGYPTTPYILLKGTWLEKAGFVIDTPVSVQVQPNRLVLTVRETA
jgi:hypothetical protein